MKIQIVNSPIDKVKKIEGYKVILTLMDGKEITIVQQHSPEDYLHITMDGRLVIHPCAANAIDILPERPSQWVCVNCGHELERSER